MVRRVNESDIPILVEIHCTELEGEFLVRLGKQFLMALYTDFLREKQTLFYLREENTIQGFIMGVTDFSSVFKTILKTHWLHYTRILLPRLLFSPRLLIETASTLFYPLFEKTTNANAELVIIAVRKEFQRQRIGSALLARLEKELKTRDVVAYKVSCTVNNTKANNFYRKHSFVLNHQFSLYFKRWNSYVKTL